jgi:starch synthase
MRVLVSTWGRFHLFHLARQLEKHGLLQAIISTYPQFKLRSEDGIPREKIKTDPFLHTALIALQRFGAPLYLLNPLANLMVSAHDQWLLKNAPDCDCLIALSGSGLALGTRLQKNGAAYICDRGSPHIRVQTSLIREEFARYGQRWYEPDERLVRREEDEYAAADMIVVPSTYAASTYIEAGLSRHKVFVIPYGGRLTRFYPDGEPPDGEFVVLFVGGIGLNKGVIDLLKAFQVLKHVKKKLIMVGLVEPGIKRLLGRYVNESVQFLGHIRNEDLRKLYSTSHVLVLPSISEGLAMVMGEALACGCPVIASRNTGATDLFSDGVEGYIVPIRDPNSIAERLQNLADCPDIRHKMRAAAVARISGLGGWDAYGDKYRSVISQLS